MLSKPVCNILILDDSPEDRAAFRRFLMYDPDWDYVVEEAELADKALERLQRPDLPTPGCLLLDFNLPDMTGVEFLSEVTGTSVDEPKAALLPCAVVMLTGSGDETAAVAAMKSGAQDYLVKGRLSGEALRHAVRNAREKFDLRRQLHQSEERLRLATQAAGVGTWDYDPQTQTAVWDARLRALFGLPGDTPVDYNLWLPLVHPEDREHAEEHIRAALDPRGTGSYTSEYRIISRENNVERWVLVEGQAQFNPERTRAERLTGTILDITERKLIEQERARHSAQQERIAETLQRSLLLTPAAHTFPGISLTTIYEAAWDEAQVGGDFSDVFPLDGGQRVALVVGDVTGKGLIAASHTAEIKFALRAYLDEHAGDPGQALSHMATYVYNRQEMEEKYRSGDARDEDTYVPPIAMVSLTLVVLDLESGNLQCCVAGAEPPVIIRSAVSVPDCVEGKITLSSCGAEEVPGSGPLLGMIAGTVYKAGTAHLESGDLLVMTTDGITEARRPRSRSDFFGLEGVAQAARTALEQDALPDVIARRIVEQARTYGGGALRDDACLLLVRRTS